MKWSLLHTYNVTYRVQHAFKCIMSEQQTWCHGMGDLARSLAGYQEGIKLEISTQKVCGLTTILSNCPEVHFGHINWHWSLFSVCIADFDFEWPQRNEICSLTVFFGIIPRPMQRFPWQNLAYFHCSPAWKPKDHRPLSVAFVLSLAQRVFSRFPELFSDVL